MDPGGRGERCTSRDRDDSGGRGGDRFPSDRYHHSRTGTSRNRLSPLTLAGRASQTPTGSAGLAREMLWGTLRRCDA